MLHIDLDQFIAAVEVLRHPELRGRPVVVGGDGDPTKRGVVATASYEARQYGVHSGLPLRTAARRCPDAVFLPVDKDAYEAASAEVMAVLRTFPGPLEVLGWDEAFLEAHVEWPEELARRVQREVRERTRLECSVGIGGNPLQAKLATGLAKPAGVFRLTSANWFQVLGDRPTDALWGIGPKTAKRLAELGLTTVAELARADPAELAARLGPTLGPWYVRLARGQDRSAVVATSWAARSRSREQTFQENLTDWAQVRAEVDRLARLVADDVAAEQRLAVRVAVKVRYAPFTTRTRSAALAAPTGDVEALVTAALAALDRFTPGRPVRLLGVRADLRQADPGPADPGPAGGQPADSGSGTSR